MDNCVFQIETALLKFDGLDESEDGKSSVVKRYVALDFLTQIVVEPSPLAEQFVLWDLATTVDRGNT